jgi:hypothetical protein
MIFAFWPATGGFFFGGVLLVMVAFSLFCGLVYNVIVFHFARQERLLQTKLERQRKAIVEDQRAIARSKQGWRRP